MSLSPFSLVLSLEDEDKGKPDACGRGLGRVEGRQGKITLGFSKVRKIKIVASYH